jgi:hypothetical protein
MMPANISKLTPIQKAYINEQMAKYADQSFHDDEKPDFEQSSQKQSQAKIE